MTTSEDLDDPSSPLPPRPAARRRHPHHPAHRAPGRIAPRPIVASLADLDRGDGEDGRVSGRRGSRTRTSAIALARGLAGAHLPLVLVTTAEEPWTEAHLVPLLKAIDHCDHVVGRRPPGRWRGVLRRAGSRSCRRSLVFAVPLARRPFPLPAAPAREARGDPPAIGVVVPGPRDPRQGDLLRPSASTRSTSRRSAGSSAGAAGWADLPSVPQRPAVRNRQVQRKKRRARTKVTTAQAARIAREGATSTSPAPSRITRRRLPTSWVRGRAWMNGWAASGNRSDGEEDAREQPLRQHDQVHQPADGLGRARPAGDQQADPGERQGPDHVHQDDQPEAAADRHVEHQGARAAGARPGRGSGRSAARRGGPGGSRVGAWAWPRTA